MPEPASCVFVTMPTSGTGSLWRLITAIGGNAYKAVKISEELENKGQGAEIPNWVPEPTGYLYMYNTPHYVNPHFANPELKLITNFRDPRDLACNQFHWALQHPISNRTDEYIANYRRSVLEAGIDHFVLKQENNVLFNSLKALAPRLSADDPNVLKLSYSQLCLDFDALIERLISFLKVDRESVPWDRLERERTGNLKENPAWIGQMWTGTDIMPGRYRTELRKDTIAALDDKYRENLKFVRALELPHLRSLLATEAEREEIERVLIGRDGELFLKKDANNTVGQITGQVKLSYSHLTRIGMAHRSRQVFGTTIANFRYGHAIIPSKEVAHRSLLPPEVVFEGNGSRPVKQYFDLEFSRIWRPFYEPSLLEPAGGSRFFPYLDSHWNHGGAFRYFSAFLANLAAPTGAILDDIPLRRFAAKQKGDLGLKLEMEAETIEIVAPIRSRGRLVFENGITNEGCVRWYRNDEIAGSPRAFIMHDSFTLWLRGFVPELFSEVLLFHGTIFDYDFVRQFAPDVVLCLQAERFFPREPETGGDMLSFISQQETEKCARDSFIEVLRSDSRFSTKTVSTKAA